MHHALDVGLHQLKNVKIITIDSFWFILSAMKEHPYKEPYCTSRITSIIPIMILAKYSSLTSSKSLYNADIYTLSQYHVLVMST